MSDLISREDAISALKALEESAPTAQHVSAIFDCEDTIRALPSTKLEQKKGEWVLYESRSDIYDLEGVCTWGKAYRCSECGFIHWVIEDFGIYSFCPNCGADMRGE